MSVAQAHMLVGLRMAENFHGGGCSLEIRGPQVQTAKSLYRHGLVEIETTKNKAQRRVKFKPEGRKLAEKIGEFVAAEIEKSDA